MLLALATSTKNQRYTLNISMGKIFCLETEWNQTVHDLKFKPSALSLLEFLENSAGIPFIHRAVATEQDFNFYIEHLSYESYKAYDLVYLCFHGENANIAFADKSKLNIIDFAREHRNIFTGKNVHFGSCSTLAMKEEELKEFKKESGARMVTGYAVDVEFINSFVFELWLLNAISTHHNSAGKRIYDLAYKQMGYYAEEFKFIAW